MHACSTLAHRPQHPVTSVAKAIGAGTGALALVLASALPAVAGEHVPRAHKVKPTHAGGHNPPGNNGTVKIHDVAGDPSHHNVPHVDCDFTVAFWGFDSDQTLTVSFTGQAPTGAGTPLAVSGAATTLTSPDDVGGGNDFDGELSFTADQLGVTALGAPHPKQGYHVKLDVATGEPGGHKYKVFWLAPCDTPAGTTPGGSTGGGDTTGGDTSAGSTAGGSSTAGGTIQDTRTRHVQRSETPSSAGQSRGNAGIRYRAGTEVVGASLQQPAASLPFTGAEIAGMTVAGAAAVGGGALLLLAGRRRRRALPR